MALDRVRFEAFEEGPCAQILHVGPFSEEGPTIQRLHQHIKDTGRNLRGRHHEIYLSDVRRAILQVADDYPAADGVRRRRQEKRFAR